MASTTELLLGVKSVLISNWSIVALIASLSLGFYLINEIIWLFKKHTGDRL